MICVAMFIVIKQTIYTHTHTYIEKWPKGAEMALDSKGSYCKAMELKSKSDIISWEFTRECVWDAHYAIFVFPHCQSCRVLNIQRSDWSCKRKEQT